MDNQSEIDKTVAVHPKRCTPQNIKAKDHNKDELIESCALIDKTPQNLEMSSPSILLKMAPLWEAKITLQDWRQ